MRMDECPNLNKHKKEVGYERIKNLLLLAMEALPKTSLKALQLLCVICF